MSKVVLDRELHDVPPPFVDMLLTVVWQDPRVLLEAPFNEMVFNLVRGNLEDQKWGKFVIDCASDADSSIREKLRIQYKSLVLKREKGMGENREYKIAA